MTDWAARLLNFKRGELRLALLAALFYFCVLSGYFFLRPVRDDMGVSRGMDDLYWLFTVTCICSLTIVLAFGGVVSRLDRRKFIPIGYGFVVICLLGFASLLIANAQAGGGLIGTESETTLARVVGYTFYVWLSVINLFINSLFWAFMVDIFNVDQAKRMFAFIGIGGTLGALLSGWITTFVGTLTDSPYLHMGLMLTGAGLFVAAIVVMLTLERAAVRSHAFPTGRTWRRACRSTGRTDRRPVLRRSHCSRDFALLAGDCPVHHFHGHFQYADLFHSGEHHLGSNRSEFAKSARCCLRVP